MHAMHAGFADELVKSASARSAVVKALARIRRSPELRRAILRSAALGGTTGLVSGAFDDKKGNALRSALVGALAGGVTGASFPGWFTHANRYAPDEVNALARLGRH